MQGSRYAATWRTFTITTCMASMATWMQRSVRQAFKSYCCTPLCGLPVFELSAAGLVASDCGDPWLDDLPVRAESGG